MKRPRQRCIGGRLHALSPCIDDGAGVAVIVGVIPVPYFWILPIRAGGITVVLNRTPSRTSQSIRRCSPNDKASASACISTPRRRFTTSFMRTPEERPTKNYCLAMDSYTGVHSPKVPSVAAQ
jgi:hypothetical protein